MLPNIVNGQVAPLEVNVQVAFSIKDSMATFFKHSLPSGFHGRIPSKVKTMEHLKRGIKVEGQSLF